MKIYVIRAEYWNDEFNGNKPIIADVRFFKEREKAEDIIKSIGIMIDSVKATYQWCKDDTMDYWRYVDTSEKGERIGSDDGRESIVYWIEEIEVEE